MGNDPLSPSEINEFFANNFYGAKDLTVILANSQAPHWWEQYCYEQAGQKKLDGKELTSFEFQQEIRATGELKGAMARLQVSRAFAGAAWSITARWEPTDAYKESRAKPKRESSKALKMLEESKDWRPDLSYGLKGSDLPAGKFPPFLFSISDVVDCLYRRIMEAADPHQGLVLVTGATNSAKSKIARGLTWRRLSDKANDPKALDRAPHLVTFEDPIEQLLCPLEISAASAAPPAIDYTPRQRRKDCASLHQGLEDALRQTPTAFYIGEIRDPQEIQQAVEFGGTGHFAIATAHAGNLLEGTGKLLKAVSASDSGSRAVFAPKMLAVIHLKMLTVKVYRIGEKDATDVSALVPAMYRRTPRGLQSLVADGLASVMPYYLADDGFAGQFGSLGRQYFAGALCRTELNPSGRIEAPADAANAWEKFRQFHAGEGDEAPPPFDTTRTQRLIDIALEEDLYGR